MRSIFAFALLVGCAALPALAATTDTCTITAGQTDQQLSFRWQRGDCATGHDCGEGDSDMPWSRWAGISPPDLTHEGATVDAQMKAEAGEMHCTGAVHDGAVHGSFSFTPDAAFISRMEAMGFANLTPERLRGYVMLDVTTEWVKAMQSAGVAGMTADNIMGLKALKVDPAYVRGMADAGYPELRADKLTGMKAVGVSPEKVQQIRAMGYSPTQEELIQMSVFKIDAPFVQKIKARGFSNPTIAQLIKIKIFKLDE